jgi:hypothetical protein
MVAPLCCKYHLHCRQQQREACVSLPLAQLLYMPRQVLSSSPGESHSILGWQG